MPYTIPFYAYTTSRFGETAGRTNAHRGHDVAPGGQDFPAWVDGVVVTAGWHSCLGNRVVIRNDADGYYIGVSHLANLKVGVGARVYRATSFRAATPLGNIGATGSCQKGRHAHITVSPSSSYPESGTVIDPVRYANNAVPNGGANPSVNYAYGLTKAAQAALQRAMDHANRYDGAIDGVFGPASVKGMQQWLKDLGYLDSGYVVDGKPGTKYGRALHELARDKGGYTGSLEGLPGPNVSAALIKWADLVVRVGAGTSQFHAYGLTEAAQRAIQGALTRLGLYSGVIDGVFGPASVGAMQRHLIAIKLLPGDYGIDGKPGPLYGRALQQLAAKHGYTGAIDGLPGDQTSAALERWAATIKAPTKPTTPDDARRWPLQGTFLIDIASTQRDIDLERAKADGAEAVIVKMGGLNVLPQYVAPYYPAQIDRARAAGLKVGHYYLIGLGQTPEEQAAYFVANLHDFRVDEDILALDNEKLDSNGTKWGDAAAARFAREVHRLTGIPYSRFWHYAGAYDYRTLQPWPELEAIGVRYWWASYGANDGTRDHEPDLDKDLAGPAIPRFDVHQFGSKVKVAGYELDGNWSPAELGVLWAKGVVTAPDVPDESEDALKWAMRPIVERIRLAADEALEALE